ncbi:MAG: N-acetyltransferase [Nocardioidaceae bacterium]|nr:N-acetyltransferase [Nocardioidaceae bacterium]NUS51493.1 N-acetyltransferase [Nocardioidaceae bacterium]
MASHSARVREERDDDHDDVRRVVSAAFGGEKVPELLDGLRGSVAWLGLSFVAEERDRVVAHVSYTRAWLDAPHKLVEVLVLSPLSVHPERQRVGIGSMLVQESLRLLEDRDEPLVFLEGDPGYYARLGFVPGDQLGFARPSVRIPEPAFQVATLTGYDQSAMSGALVYPDVFWRHDCVGLRPER